MRPRQLTDHLSVAEQISLDDIAEIAALGFKSIINNRPDGEVPAQPASAEVAAEAARHGLQYGYVPVVSGAITADDVAHFAAAVAALPSPVLAFCRSGTRSTFLWGLSERGRRPDEDIVGRAADAGYDLSMLARHR